MKLIKLGILLVCMTFTKVHAQQINQEKINWYDFIWEGEDKNPREAMMLKSRIEPINFTFRWQFDTGSPRTFFYGNVWNSFVKAFPELKKEFPITDSTKSDGYINLRNKKIKVSGKLLPKNIIGLYENYGQHIDKELILQNLGSSTVIGTIGIDMFRDGVLVIDFKQQKIGYASKFSDNFYANNKSTTDIILYQNRILIPVTIDKQTRYFFYDSGASLFPLKSTASFSKLLPAVVYTDTLKNITTWGKSHDVPGGIFKKPVKIAGKTIKSPKIYIHPDPDQYHTNIFKEAEAFGLIGNSIFENKILIFDFTRMKMTLLD